MNLICKLFGHKVAGLMTKRYFASCARCRKGLKVSYDTTFGQTLVIGDYGEQKTFCWCDCGNELCSTGSYHGLTYRDGYALERYKCSSCGDYSWWDFGPPVPIKVN